jgi:PBSX family phage terminase large subunit
MELLNNYKPIFNQFPLTRYFLLTGSRGSAKSFHVSTALLHLTYEKGHIILFTRWTLVSAYISIIPEFIQKIEELNRFEDFEITQTEITNRVTGSKILFKGIKTSQGTATANLKSIAGVTTFVLDEAEELVDEDIFDRIDLSIRTKGMTNRVVIVMNPSYKSHWIYKRFLAKGKQHNTCYIHTTYLDNAINLSASFLEQANRVKQENQLRYEHLFLGKWLEDAEGLLWNRAMIARAFIDVAPKLKRIVVSIDPAVTATSESDETGIIVCGRDQNDNGYILEDLSGKYSPNEWAIIAVKSVERWSADCIVAEKNQGGDMVESVLRSQGAKHRVKLVTATKGKFVRAEPVYSLYEQNRIFHVGNLSILESQMVTFNPDKGKSPDRVDALVWGLTELMIKIEIDYKGKGHGRIKSPSKKEFYKDFI